VDLGSGSPEHVLMMPQALALKHEPGTLFAVCVLPSTGAVHTFHVDSDSRARNTLAAAYSARGHVPCWQSRAPAVQRFPCGCAVGRPVCKLFRKKDCSREAKALRAANIENSIEKELLERLRTGLHCTRTSVSAIDVLLPLYELRCALHILKRYWILWCNNTTLHVRLHARMMVLIAAMVGAGTYGDIYNFPMQQYESALDEVWR
jgi:hypothetical protein